MGRTQVSIRQWDAWLPGNSPVVYPTQATYYYGFRQTQNPPWWPKAINWIDQN